MLKADQIPDEVARLADEAYYDTAGENPTMSDENIMKHAIAAALNAWPGAARHDFAHADGEECIILPLPKEVSDE